MRRNAVKNRRPGTAAGNLPYGAYPYDLPISLMTMLGGITATLVRTMTGGMGRRPAVKVFELARWMPSLLSCI